MVRKVYLFLLFSAALACKASPGKLIRVSDKDLLPDEQQVTVCKKIAELITNYNYKKVALNDSISTVIYNRYLKALDENRSYLLASDIREFEKYKTELDDDVKEGNLNAVFYMFNVLQKRYLERVNYSLVCLKQNFDFNQADSFVYDRDKLPWINSPAEMDELWKHRVKFDLLNLKLANADMAKNKETLRKRYESLLSQSNKLSNQDVFQYFMDAFTEAIDPHTNYFNPSNAANFNIEMSRQVEGIGISPVSENEYVTIKSIVPGGPVDKSKQIGLNDRIVGVAQGKTGEFQNIVGWRIDNAIALIRGTKGTVVRLEILPAGASAGGKPKVVELVREKIILKDQSAKKEIRTYNSADGKMVKIGVIAIPAFYIDYNDYKAGNPNYKSTTHDVKLLLDSLKDEHVDGVMIDLRENGGGSLMEAIELTGLFIKQGPVVQVRDASNRVDVEKDEDEEVAYTGPLGVLVDRFSASASEIFSGAIQDYGRGIIMGTQTYGKGSVQSSIDLDKVLGSPLRDKINQLAGKAKNVSTGSQSTYGQLNLTIAKFYRISGNSTQHKGVIPDIQFPSVIPLDKYGEDTEPSAMPFDVIDKTDYVKAGDFSAVLPKLIEQHDQRMASSSSYKYILDDIAAIKKQDAETTVSLREADLKKQRDEEEKASFDRNNLRRQALGLPVLKKGETKTKEDDLDFVKREAGQIMTDYITLA
ncbi:carboxy terminal-processing peptidase [Deminuibacter soli]|uniref:Tail-specific protease n=1 Tax=Deminuibacter soli TaxID=2291815 RepID=A0A3E1NJ49_9BACT|nr:carboxy terminal-processing peptidase [Deminuibacter soli]RFM27808.1 tail-specific protease [Deminuibacter soli]